ncbi:MAG: hypothetical protein COT18_05945 [Elusimicrobia bacterium CG08_land_8_20_14_0_20_59_10]|nr:MAG: hypothetical protein COT18_05945 [Elusimicrobia bacterium CG08_land_8_20_14_0_20_59_10]
MAKILLVDDDSAFQTMLLYRFVDAGFEVEPASNGNEALEKLKTFKADLLILDVNMPGLNGIELIKILRAKDETRDLPIIFMTGSSYSEINVAWLAPELKHQVLLNKTTEWKVVLEKVQSLLNTPPAAK